jgi:quaternary ammonium compound-resistance protein SugE
VPIIQTLIGCKYPSEFLAKATQAIPLGTAYPVWTGIGAVGAVLVGILIFREPATFWRLFFLTTLIGSIIGLKALS